MKMNWGTMMLKNYKYKSVVLAALSAGLLSTSLLAAPPVSKDTMSEIQKFYFKLGSKQGHMNGVEEGYNKALMDFKKLLHNYKAKIRALEAGKYLVENGKITYPKVYKIRKGSSYQIKIKAPVVEREFTSDDLFIIPMLNGKDVQTENMSLFDGEIPGEPKKYSNGMDLPDIESMNRSVRPNSVGNIRETISVQIPYKSADAKKFLEIFGSNYSETSNGYIVNFSNAREKRKFCKEFTGDNTCEKISEGAL